MEHHPSFVKRLADSDPVKYKVAQELESRGYSVTSHVTKLAPDRESSKEYVDKGDLHVDGKRIEVKGLSTYFWDTYWPWPDFIVCNCASYDRAEKEKDQPYAYIYLDKTLKHVAVVHPGLSRPFWSSRWIFDREREASEPFYCIKTPYALFGPFSQLDELLLLESADI